MPIFRIIDDGIAAGGPSPLGRARRDIVRDAGIFRVAAPDNPFVIADVRAGG